MIALSSILVDIDALSERHPALEQAVDLASRSGARVKVVDVLPGVPSNARHFVTARIEEELVEHRRTRLTGITASVKNVPISIDVLRGRSAHALIQDVLRSRHDLVVRSHGRDPANAPERFGAVDMELLRQCPCPVWLVGPRRAAHTPRRILAAIHVAGADATERALNTTILEWALMLKELARAELTILQAWTVFGGSVLRSRLRHDEFAECVEAARRAAEEGMTVFTEPFGNRLEGVTVDSRQGEPEEAIAEFVESRGTDVVVMGTVARTGIAGLLMGNTAERILQRLGGSVLAVKPPGFESPVVLSGPSPTQ